MGMKPSLDSVENIGSAQLGDDIVDIRTLADNILSVLTVAGKIDTGEFDQLLADTVTLTILHADMVTLYDLFDDRYLGDKATEPTLDNDGDALVTGAIYHNTTENITYVYDVSVWQPIADANTATLVQQLYDEVRKLILPSADIVTNGFSTVNGAGDPLSATDAGLLQYDTTDDVYYVYTGTTWEALLDPVKVKTAYESNADTNAYTDAEKTKVGHISVTQAVDLDTIESDTALNNAKQTNVTTDLSYTASPTNGTVVSSDGTDATVPVADVTNAGLMAPGDKSKLDGLESGATADQTGAEIKVAYEGEADTNAFTDGEQTKLSSLPDLAAINQLYPGLNPVDVFIYDTSKDTDGGAWRMRAAENASYAKEGVPPGNYVGRMSSAAFIAAGHSVDDWRMSDIDNQFYSGSGSLIYRAGSPHFPSSAAIVAEVDRVLIFDITKDVPEMWMVFSIAGSYGGVDNNLLADATRTITSTSAKQGSILCGLSNAGITYIDLIKDAGYRYSAGVTGDDFRVYNGNIALRNNREGERGLDSRTLVNSTINDVALTVLSDAPIDPTRGIATPTIAVATDGGVSVIKDDGNIWDLTVTTTYKSADNIWFDGNVLKFTGTASSGTSFDYTYCIVETLPIADESGTHWGNLTSVVSYGSPTSYSGAPVSGAQIPLLSNELFYYVDSRINAGDGSVIGRESGLTFLDHNSASPDNSMVAYIDHEHNTGWQHGDSKLAALCETKRGNLLNYSEEFDNAVWTDPNGDITVTGNTVTAPDGSTTADTLTLADSNCLLRQTTQLVEGREYNISFWLKSTSAALITELFIDLGDGAKLDYAAQLVDQTVWTRVSANIVAGASDWADIELRSSSGGDVYIWGAQLTEGADLLPYMKTPSVNLVTNGTFDADTDWTKFTGGTSVCEITGGVLHISRGDSLSYAQQACLEEGREYVITLDAVMTSGGCAVWFGDSGNQQVISSTGAHSYTFVASGDTLTFYANTSSDFTIDNVVIYEAISDRSVNGNGLQEIGHILKAPVANNAELIAYSGFSANDYLEQPYNADLDIPDGSQVSISFTAYLPEATSVFHPFERGELDNVGSFPRFGLISISPGISRFYLDDGVNTALYSAVMDWTQKAGYTHITCTIDTTADTIAMYIDGELYSSLSGTIGTLANSLAQLTIGRRAVVAAACDSGIRISQFRISKSIPSADQIKHIYETERKLFEEGAKCTLDGNSDSVTDVAYDESTDTYHVATDFGVSEFSGLERVSGTWGDSVELVSNGELHDETDWSLGADWSISLNKAVMASTSTYNALSQTIATEIDSYYVLGFTVDEITNNCKVDVASTTYTFGSTGNHNHIFKAENTTQAFGFARSTNPSAMTISNISVRKLSAGELAALSASNGKLLSGGTGGALIEVPETNLRAELDSLKNIANLIPHGDLEWKAPALLNSWVNYETGYQDAGFIKDSDGYVSIRGMVKSGTITAGTDLFVLPVGYRPSAAQTFVVTCSSYVFAVVTVTATGAVEIASVSSNAWLSLDNIRFKV